MSELKYIIDNENRPLIFSTKIFHDEVSHKAKSAGFLHIIIDNPGKIKVHCYGESKTLGIKSDPVNDNKIIERFLNE